MSVLFGRMHVPGYENCNYTFTRADKCLPSLLVDLAISAGVESTLPVRPVS